MKHIEAEIPKTLIQREVDFIVTQTAMQLSRQGIDLSKFLTKDLVDNMRENAKPEAVERLNRTLALGEIAKQESLAITDEAVKARTEEMMAEVDDPSQVDPERLNQVVNEDLLKEKILGWLKENSNVELVPEGSLVPDEAEADESDVAIASDGTVDVESVEVADETVENPEAEEIAEPESEETVSESTEVAAETKVAETEPAKSKKPKAEKAGGEDKKSKKKGKGGDKKSKGKK